MAERGEVQSPATQPDVAAPAPTAHHCAHCGQPARVCVLQGYRDGEPVMGYYCLTCPPELAVPQRAARRGASRLSLPVLLCLAALVLGLAGGASDLLISGSSPGFGWYQRVGVIVGAVVLLLGVLMRVDVIALAGVFVFGGALCWDWFGVYGSPGLGWKQQTTLLIAILLLAVAVITEIVTRVRSHARA